MIPLRDLIARPYMIFDLFHTLSTLVHAGVGGPNLFELLGVSRERVNDALFVGSEARLTGRISDPAEVIADIARRCGVNPTREQCASAAAQRGRRFAESLRNVSPHILSTLDCLRDAGRRLALISNADVTEASGWEDSPLASRFDVALLSYRVGLAKPDPEIYHLCMRQLGATPDECVFVGDGGSNEFEGARRAGIPSICTTEFTRDIFPKRVDAHSAQADCVVAALFELCTAAHRRPSRASRA